MPKTNSFFSKIRKWKNIIWEYCLSMIKSFYTFPSKIPWRFDKLLNNWCLKNIHLRLYHYVNCQTKTFHQFIIQILWKWDNFFQTFTLENIIKSQKSFYSSFNNFQKIIEGFTKLINFDQKFNLGLTTQTSLLIMLMNRFR